MLAWVSLVGCLTVGLRPQRAGIGWKAVSDKFELFFFFPSAVGVKSIQHPTFFSSTLASRAVRSLVRPSVFQNGDPEESES